MNTSLRSLAVLLSVSAALAVLALPRVALSGPSYDHLECYKVKDPLARGGYSATVDLVPSQTPEFPSDSGCVLKKLKAKEVCIPVRKEVKQSDAPGAQVSGIGLGQDFLCYKIKCSKPATAIAALQMSDQFGTREIDGFKTARLCVPAIKGAPPSPSTTTTTACIPGTEVCDGLDNNCNDQIDEDVVGPACPLQLGVCEGANQLCVGGVLQPCDAATYGANYEAEEVSCDSLDNDCDGLTDEVCP